MQKERPRRKADVRGTRLHAAIARAPATAMENVVARNRRVMLGSLPPTLCVDALGGHLARRWGALLRHLRLPRLGHQARLFIHLDPLLARNRRDQLANRFERQIVRRLEMNATLPHVEFLPRRLERLLQLLELTRTPKRAHQGRASSSSSATRARRSRS